MKNLALILICSAVAGVAGGAAGAAAVQARYGAMPDNWAAWSQVAHTAPPGQPNALGGVVGQVATTAMPNGGPQALEGYAYLSHPDGVTRLALGIIGNVEVAGSGGVTEVRSMQSGGIISGTGKVDRWVGLMIGRPAGAAGAKVPFYPLMVTDPDAQNVIRGTITTDRIRFANGWTLQAGPGSVHLIDERGVVRQEF